MNITLEKQSDCKVGAHIEVPADVVNSERAKIVAAFSTQAKIPGYRPGKIPSKIIETRFAKGIEEELRERLVRTGCNEAVEKEGQDVLGIGKVGEATFNPDQTFTFTAELITAPEFTLPEYKNIPVKLPSAAVTEQEIDATMENLRERYAEFAEVEGPLKEGHFAVISYMAKLDGKPLVETDYEVGVLAENEDFWVKIDEKSFLPGFTPQLLGLNPGDKKEVTVVLAEDFPFEDLRGKELVYDVEIKTIQEQSLPDLNDELAERIEAGKSLADIRSLIEQSLGSEKENRRQEEMSGQILRFLGEDLNFELPEHLVRGETQRMVNTMVQQGQQSGMDNDTIMEHQEQILDSAAVSAKSNVKITFILEQIAKEENIAASDDDIRQQVAMMAAQSGRPVKKIVRELRDSNSFEEIRNRITIGRTLEFLKANANVTEAEGDPGTVEK
jgi:trigger factor